MKFENKVICILGLSKSGISSAKHLIKKAKKVTISESREARNEDISTIKKLEKLGINIEMGGNNQKTIDDCDVVVTSPGIPPHADVYKMVKQAKKPVISEIDVAFLEANDKTFIAITGTNGKTTTTKLTAEILQAQGLKAEACGNIGLPPTSLLGSDVDYFVCEVSSYQIETSQYFSPEIACFLNYSPDHIDWHGSEKAYFEAKESLFHRSENCILNENDPKVIDISKNCKNVIPFGKKRTFISEKMLISENKPLLSTSEISLKGEHNLENIMAAVTIAKKLGCDDINITRVLKTFKPPEHRLEYVATINNKKYYNDSKATNTDAAIKSVQAFKGESLTVIAGGKDKGTNLDEFVTTLQDNVDCVILIGEATKRFEAALKQANFSKIEKADTLEEAIEKASTKEASNILLAPACASFDMFKSFEDRGNTFKEYVLKKEKNS